MELNKDDFIKKDIKKDTHRRIVRDLSQPLRLFRKRRLPGEADSQRYRQVRLADKMCQGLVSMQRQNLQKFSTVSFKPLLPHTMHG